MLKLIFILLWFYDHLLSRYNSPFAVQKVQKLNFRGA
jgi:hypothetical protein